MAFCIGYPFSGVSHPCSLNINSKFQKYGNMTNLIHARYLSTAYMTRQRSIINAKDSSSYPSFSRLQKPLGEISKESDQKIQGIRNLLRSKGDEEQVEGLVFVDAIQRFGVNRYFEEEIETILRRNYATSSVNTCHYRTLHDVSLFFRLLRQHEYYISSDVFNNFKGEDGKFRGEFRHDVKGLMELYEAAQLGFEGESTLDEAEYFSWQNLENCMAEMDDYLCRIVRNKLRHPFHKSIGGLTERKFLDDIGDMFPWGKTLGELATMDLHTRKSLYRRELFQVSEWWNKLGLAESLSLARNQPLKWYTWSMAFLIEDISLSEQRIELTKSISFIYLIDDIFDVYGELDELVLFVEAINKWDYVALDTLPDYMKMCYKALLDTTNEISGKIYDKYGYNPIDSLKTTWARLCYAFLVEAKWLASGDLPNAAEYLENGKVSTGAYVVVAHLFFLLGLGGTHGGSLHLDKTSQLMSSVSIILRLWDDLGSAKDEDQVGKDGSYIKCYMKEHTSSSVSHARSHAIELIAKEWKRLNTEYFKLNDVSVSTLKRAALNGARMVPLMYNYDDNQRLPILEEYVKYMLFDRLDIHEHYHIKEN